MRSDLFIEHVDTEWSLRALSAGYRCYCVPNAVLMHSIGDSAVKLFGKNIYLYSDSRYYYKLRNEVYLARLKTMGKNWRAYILPAILYHFVIYVAFSKNRLAVFRLLVKAIGDGIRGSLGPLSERPEAAPSANTL
jgi:rhamnosyltransferase